MVLGVQHGAHPVLGGETSPLSQCLTLITSQFGDATGQWGLGAGVISQVGTRAPLGTLVAFGGTERPQHMSLSTRMPSGTAGKPFWGVTVISGGPRPQFPVSWEASKGSEAVELHRSLALRCEWPQASPAGQQSLCPHAHLSTPDFLGGGNRAEPWKGVQQRGVGDLLSFLTAPGQTHGIPCSWRV